MNDAIYAVTPYPNWVEIADQLESEGFRPRYWLAVNTERSGVEARFDDVVFHPFRDARRGVFPESLADHAAVVDSKTVERFRPYESNIVQMLGRLDAGYTFSYSERMRTYRRLLSFYLGLVDAIDPAYVVFGLEPHMVANYTLYAVAKELGVDTYMCSPTRLPGICYVQRTVGGTSDQIETAYQQLADGDPSADLPPHLDEYLTELAAETPSDDAGPRQLNPFRKLASVAFNTVRYLAPFSDLEYTHRNTATYLKRRAEPLEQSRMRSVLEFAHYDLKAYWHRRKLLSAYTARTQPTDFEYPFVYVPLHYQPEKATMPLGGVYDDQYLMVQVLTDAMPDDWRLLVKEHPWQFQKLDSHQGRDAQFYADLAALPDVELVPTGTSSLRLIDHAHAVATVTGTAGWEGVVRDTPVFTFGDAWYSICEGVFDVETTEDVEDAVKTIRSDPPSFDIKRFASAVVKGGYTGWLGLTDMPDDMTHESNTRTTLAGLREELWRDGHLPAQN